MYVVLDIFVMLIIDIVIIESLSLLEMSLNRNTVGHRNILTFYKLKLSNIFVITSTPKLLFNQIASSDL